LLFVNNQISISISEFEFAFSRSPGPGGQNVNKVNSKATLSWFPEKSSGLTKLREMVLLAAVVPKSRKITKPSFSSQRRRLDNKKKKSEKKNMRRSNVKFD
jgi:ribosome-associated protein